MNRVLLLLQAKGGIRVENSGEGVVASNLVFLYFLPVELSGVSVGGCCLLLVVGCRVSAVESRLLPVGCRFIGGRFCSWLTVVG
jgi:hypothetical protein